LTCYTLSEVQTAYADTTGGSDDLKLQLRAACIAANPLLESCTSAQLVFPERPADCSSICPICDQSAQCELFNDADNPVYRCYEGRCVQKTCSTTTDEAGNVVATYAMSDATFTDNREYCLDLCGAEPPAKNDTDLPCDRDEMGDDGCYYPCRLQADGNMYLSTEPELTVNALGDADSLAVYREFCKDRNSELADCPAGAIVPRQDGSGCGCGVCLESCAVERQFITYLDGDVKKCRKYECTTEEVVTTATLADPYLSTTYERTYTNVRKTVTTADVELTFCTGTGDTTTTTSRSPEDECVEPCSGYDRDRAVCYEDADGNQMTFKCPEAFKCYLRELVASGGDATYSFVDYGECERTTETLDECTLGDMMVTDRRVSTSKCPVVCKCVENPEGAEYRNIWLCDTLERHWINIKERCADKLGAETCTFERLYYAECPSYLDDDICSKLYCDTTRNVNDPTVVGDAFVCRESAEGFSEDLSVRDESTGCTYRECDDDPTSSTYGQIVERRYDEDTVTATRIVYACPELADCRGVTSYETNKLCGVCPTCGADETNVDNTERCSRDTIERGDAACVEDPLEDPTRDDTEEIAGRCRVAIKQRMCAERFLGYTKDELYEKLKSAAMYVARQCSDIDSFDYLRAAITALDYEPVDAALEETCGVVLRVSLQIDYSDVDLARLRALAECLNAMTDVRERVADAITTTTTGDRADENGDADMTGAYASGDTTSAAEIYLTEPDGTVLETAEPTTTGDSTNTREGNDANRYGVMLAVVAAVVAGFLQ
jgi:hypothetical protein